MFVKRNCHLKNFKTKHKDSTDTNGSIDDSVNDESSYFCNFGHKETGTNSDDVTTTYVWFNKEKKILLDEWKNGFKSKDPSKYVKYMLRLLHMDENGGYEENLSKRCVSSDKPSYTPRGMNRRVSLTLNEHLTLAKCMKTYLNKTSKLTSEEANKIIAKQNAFITEEINTCVKNQKKKLNI
ncbi:uncharacterized protein LOC131671723 [Phymastichus coffea]|uniref:uncharacterized protein LOC131671723 n=1 Tax=Phymastichus coffea TaxID=108790 RepID=UPI00273BF6B9|nr:uncharacterized protein LOC131671723 [Phymastichus coffea]